MSKQPEALGLADWIKNEEFYQSSDPFINDKMDKVEAQLRRLHEVNQELLETLNQIDMAGILYNETPVECVGRLRAIAIDAIKKATGE